MNYIPYTLSECLSEAARWQEKAFTIARSDTFLLWMAQSAADWYSAAKIARSKGVVYIRKVGFGRIYIQPDERWVK